MENYKIDKKIVDISIKTKDEIKIDDQIMNEKIQRPENLYGTTYKLKIPIMDNALYITINNYILNEGMSNETIRPFEIFINSSNMEHYQWVTALTRIISAVFRKGGDINFLTGELQSIFDPNGGYFKKGRYIPSIVAEIGITLEKHIKLTTMLGIENKLKDEPKKETLPKTEKSSKNEGGFPKNSILCKKCHMVAVTRTEGCLSCLNCGDSKCS